MLKQFPPLEEVRTDLVPTDAAAHYLLRSPQTLRSWACYGTGPINPKRISGRLAWPVARIRELTGAAT